MIVVILMVMTVDVLLLFAAGRLMGQGVHLLRVFLGALLDAVFTALSFLYGFAFMNHILWRLCSLILIALVSFGLTRKTPGKLLLFCVLHLSLGGISGNRNEIISSLLGAAGIGFACLAVGRHYDLIPVSLTYGNRTLHITALRDNGNTLRDPVTGKQVLVVGADVAEKLIGLPTAVLRDPVSFLDVIPGLRLIPYQSVGNTGFLLALRLPEVRIGNRQGSALVAFSPQILGKRYQALTGGTV